jgi:TusA-related sulfurtransferase
VPNVRAKKDLPPPNAEVDVTDAVCPMTFVKAKVALDDLDPGQVLSIHINDGEPLRNVPSSLKDDGHQVLGLADNGDGTYQLLVKKGQD